MADFPRERTIDSTLALLGDPYRFVSRRCDRFGSDAFETRLMLRRTVCLRGSEAAALFYDERRFRRRGAMPAAIRKTLLGQGGVQGLDDGDHRHRKAMLLSLMAPAHIQQLVQKTEHAWLAAAHRWAKSHRVVFYDAVREVLTRSVCEWAGVPLSEGEVGVRTRQLSLLFDGAGSASVKHFRSRAARKQANAWCGEVIEAVREGRRSPAESTAAHVIATHRDRYGKPLDRHVAAVALLNVLRPTVAVSVFVTFLAHALHLHPGHRERIASGDAQHAERFVQEVRRYYPFFPAVAAITRTSFEWNGFHFPEGRWVLLDLYGTNHDPKTWDDPGTFRPERFATWGGSAFDFIPQGGGDHAGHHRCAGEWITIELMKMAARILTQRLGYNVPGQDLRVDFRRLPALPRSGFIVRNVRVV